MMLFSVQSEEVIEVITRIVCVFMDNFNGRMWNLGTPEILNALTDELLLGET